MKLEVKATMDACLHSEKLMNKCKINDINKKCVSVGQFTEINELIVVPGVKFSYSR